MCKNLPFPRRSHINPYKSPSAETSSIYKLKNPKQLNQFKRNIPKNPFSCELRTQINRQTNSGAKLVTTLFFIGERKKIPPWCTIQCQPKNLLRLFPSDKRCTALGFVWAASPIPIFGFACIASWTQSAPWIDWVTYCFRFVALRNPVEVEQVPLPSLCT